ncbi:hypothetical protein QYF61_020124 [Mycteria americana]|uniref:Uncharacterized protein n=1 Tax=Mycteria americana TaxID=33587 RepID=A0AAN7RZP8_MYCAM|nr:hypothetical protein QYF61_020124 [Mycteria americana]
MKEFGDRCSYIYAHNYNTLLDFLEFPSLTELRAQIYRHGRLMISTHHRGWCLNHFPGKPVPMLDNPFSEVKFPNIQSKPPLAQLEAISSCPATCYLGEETDPHLSTTSFQAKQPQFPQPLLTRLVLQTLHQLRCPSLDSLQHLNVSLVVGGPKLNTVFEVRPHERRVQGDDHFPSPAGHAIFDTSQDAIGFLGHLGTLLAHIQLAVDQHSQVLFCQAAFQPLFPKPVALHGVVVAQVQDLALSLAEPHTIGPSPSIQPVQSLAPLKQINTPAQLGVVCKLTEGALDPFVQIIDKDIKQNWPQHRALGNTACDRMPTGGAVRDVEPRATLGQAMPSPTGSVPGGLHAAGPVNRPQHCKGINQVQGPTQGSSQEQKERWDHYGGLRSPPRRRGCRGEDLTDRRSFAFCEKLLSRALSSCFIPGASCMLAILAWKRRPKAQVVSGMVCHSHGRGDDDSAVDFASSFDLPFCKSRLLASQILNRLARQIVNLQIENNCFRGITTHINGGLPTEHSGKLYMRSMTPYVCYPPPHTGDKQCSNMRIARQHWPKGKGIDDVDIEELNPPTRAADFTFLPVISCVNKSNPLLKISRLMNIELRKLLPLCIVEVIEGQEMRHRLVNTEEILHCEDSVKLTAEKNSGKTIDFKIITKYCDEKLNNPSSLSRSSQDLCSRPFTSSVALLWTRSSTSMSLL